MDIDTLLTSESSKKSEDDGDSSLTKEENVSTEMAAPLIQKPTIEYAGYQRTITEVIKIRSNLDSLSPEIGDNAEDTSTEVNNLLLNLDHAIKECRILRYRLANIQRRKSLGKYSKRGPKDSQLITKQG